MVSNHSSKKKKKKKKEMSDSKFGTLRRQRENSSADDARKRVRAAAGEEFTTASTFTMSQKGGVDLNRCIVLKVTRKPSWEATGFGTEQLDSGKDGVLTVTVLVDTSAISLIDKGKGMHYESPHLLQLDGEWAIPQRKATTADAVRVKFLNETSGSLSRTIYPYSIMDIRTDKYGKFGIFDVVRIVGVHLQPVVRTTTTTLNNNKIESQVESVFWKCGGISQVQAAPSPVKCLSSDGAIDMIDRLMSMMPTPGFRFPNLVKEFSNQDQWDKNHSAIIPLFPTDFHNEELPQYHFVARSQLQENKEGNRALEKTQPKQTNNPLVVHLSIENDGYAKVIPHNMMPKRMFPKETDIDIDKPMMVECHTRTTAFNNVFAAALRIWDLDARMDFYSIVQHLLRMYAVGSIDVNSKERLSHNSAPFYQNNLTAVDVVANSLITNLNEVVCELGIPIPTELISDIFKNMKSRNIPAGFIDDNSKKVKAMDDGNWNNVYTSMVYLNEDHELPESFGEHVVFLVIDKTVRDRIIDHIKNVAPGTIAVDEIADGYGQVVPTQDDYVPEYTAAIKALFEPTSRFFGKRDWAHFFAVKLYNPPSTEAVQPMTLEEYNAYEAALKKTYDDNMAIIAEAAADKK